MTERSEPALSVVVVTRDHYRRLRPLVRSLAVQTIADRLELVVVAPADAGVTLPATDVAAFHGARVVTRPTVRERGEAAAVGVLAARAPIVALAENHCFPLPDWAARVVAAHDGPHAAVGPAMINANPETAISQALQAFGYGMFHRGRPAGPDSELPLHNSSYRKDRLPQSVAELEPLLADETALQRRLVAGGNTFWFDPSAVKRHLNEATWSWLIGLLYHSGRRYGGTRARDWSGPRRAAYIAATPLLAIPIARSIWRKTFADSAPRKTVGLAIVVWAAGQIHAIGEAVSYLLGPPGPSRFLEQEEYMIRERLGPHRVTDPELIALLALLDADA